MLQLLPSQCRILSPTAQTSLAETAASPFRLPALGLLTILQAFPRQCSISVLLKLLSLPTAQTLFAETTVTAFSRGVVPVLGLETTFHWPQASASARALVPVI